MFKKYRVQSKTRFAFFIIITFMIIVCGINLIFGTEYVSGSSEPVYESVIVKSGDTLWNIALDYVDDNTDIRMFIYDISKINELESSELMPGQELLIPVL